MASTKTLPKIEEKIQISATAVVSSIAEMDDAVAGAVIGRKTTVHLVINGSFLYRDKSMVKTNQSHRRLVASLAASGKRVRSENLSIIDNETIKTHYKMMGPPDAAKVTTLTAAVTQELANTGDLLFTLLGTMKGMRPQTQAVDGKKVRELRLIPSLTGPNIQRAGEGIYSITRILPIEELLEFINEDLKPRGGISAEDRRVIGTSYDKVLDQVTTEVAVPSGKIQDPTGTILGKIVISLREQADKYRKALDVLRTDSDDPRAFNEVLRIAYNFSADVLPLISLFVSICDLKPLIFWCTLSEQWTLHKAFASLPWAALGRKEKLEEYKSIVSQARSHAFHHVLPFDSTVEIDLSTLDVRAEKIRLFVPFGQKEGRGVHLRDQKLAEVLSEFSRPKERPVSQIFWRANLAVIQAACRLAEEVLSALILIHDARRDVP
jgi:hypothetical protein